MSYIGKIQGGGEVITLERVDTKAEELSGAIVPVMERAGAIVVSDAVSFETAGNTVKELTGLEKQIKAFWEDDVTSALKLHRSLVAKRDSMLVPVGEQKKSLTNGMKTWADEQERARREAQEKAETMADGPVLVESNVPAGFGTAIRKTWSAEVVDLMALVKAVASGKVPLTAIEANMTFLNGQARALKNLLAYDGVRAIEK